MLLEFVQSKTPKGEPEAILSQIDEFCTKNWMMNVGEEKGNIVKDVLKRHQPKSILELGCYCGYSSMMMAHYSQAAVHTIRRASGAVVASPWPDQDMGLAQSL